MEEEVQNRLTEMGITEEDLQNPDKVKEINEKLEADAKAAKGSDGSGKQNKVLNDQLGRLAKNISKQMNGGKADESPEVSTLSELDVDNRVFAKTQGLTGEQLEIIKEHSHLPRNKGKSFEEIFATSAAKADLSDIQAANDATNEIDANATPDKLLSTKNEIYEKYSQTGEEPTTDYERKIVAEKGLEEMGLKNF